VECRFEALRIFAFPASFAVQDDRTARFDYRTYIVEMRLMRLVVPAITALIAEPIALFAAE
jgi:hypothetical protein